MPYCTGAFALVSLSQRKKQQESNNNTYIELDQQPPEDDFYKMDHGYRGVALIFNHENFDSPFLNSRRGTSKDATDLRDVLSKLGFRVDLYNDQSKNEIFEIINIVSKMDHSQNDCLIVAIMTHGKSNGRLYAKDYDYSIDTIVEEFSGRRCSTLVGKPKLFFIQACRGEKTDPGAVLRTDSANTNNIQRIPVMADILIMYATVEGYYAWRDTKNGSWFIQTLAKQLEKHYKTKELLYILTAVNRHVAFGYTSASSHPDFDKKKEMSSIVSMLTKSLYFK
ncbi:caspase-1-like isoform X2 [Rhynchophorus ferrugineus]|uniref:caspase-1-like isoform X2 n=1 Tax=Rhynchophorus ferrugineus TaxID=354439 RepID=UPI003FCE6C92